MNLSEKQAEVSRLHEAFASSNAAFIVNLKGCKTSQIEQFRRQVRAAGGSVRVVKNTLAKRAAQNTQAEVLSDSLKGPTAIVWSGDDPVASAKVITEFAKSTEAFSYGAAAVSGAKIESKGVADLASLPSREVLMAQLLGLINAPASQLLRLLNAPGSGVVRLVDAWKAEMEKRQNG